MDLTFTDQETAFRDELREWLSSNPAGQAPTRDDASYAWRRDWQRKLHEGGWAGVHWPVEYGGPGGTLLGSALLFLGARPGPAPPPPHPAGPALGRPAAPAVGDPR